MPRETIPPPQAGPRFRATDSPWFWMLVFSTTAAVGMAAIAPKFAVRQARLESRWAGREQAATERARRAAGLAPTDLADDARDPDDEPRRVVPLWPLAIAAGIAAVVSAAMLRREWSSG